MSNANKDISSQIRVCMTKSQNKFKELCESHQV